MNFQAIVAALHRKYHREKWVLTPREIWRLHDSMGIQNKKYHIPEVEKKLHEPNLELWFGLKSGIIFDVNEFTLIGDAMDILNLSYSMKGSIKAIFLEFEGYTLYYMNQGQKKKMTLSGAEIAFLKELIFHCEQRARSEAA